MRGLLLILVCFTFLHAKAQWPSERWHSGEIVLEEGDTLRGKIKYDMEQNMVQYIGRDLNQRVFYPKKVVSFVIYDEGVGHHRKFYTLLYEMTPGFKGPVFFELLSDGKLALFSRETINVVPTGSGMAISREMLIYKLYLMGDDGEIKEFRGTKSALLAKMGRYSQQVNEFIKKNRLTVSDVNHFIRIIAYYNALVKG